MGEGASSMRIGGGETMVGLDHILERYTASSPMRTAVADVVRVIAETSIRLEMLIAKGALAGALDEADAATGDGDCQTTLDLIADDMLTDALTAAPIAVIGSEKRPEPLIVDVDAPIAVVMGSLDGSSNVDTNMSVGTLFAILPATADLERSVLQPGHSLIGAGFVIYGPQTCLVLTLGEGTDIYTLDRDDRRYLRTASAVDIASEGHGCAINTSNYRHWDKAIQAYIDDNVAGADGPGGRNYTTHWTGSLVAEAYRILIRGGIFLDPGDRRQGYERGRHRLVCEANPLAMIIEQAGGLATDGEDRILDIQPRDWHQCVPLIFGSSDQVERVRKFHDGTLSLGERSPLFGRRGLFRH